MKFLGTKILAVVLVCAMMLTSLLISPFATKEEVLLTTSPQENTASAAISQNANVLLENLSSEGTTVSVVPSGEYNEGIVLVKSENAIADEAFGDLAPASVEPLYIGAKWYKVTLGDSMTSEEAVQYLASLEIFDAVDYDYIMNTGADTSSVDVSCNPDYKDYKHHEAHKIPEGWEEVKKNGKHPGGSPDVIVAVIDTGVDYNHIDLRNNIWVNSAEIPDNGIDDDGNGYIDDVRGWDCVGDDNDPMDDNGHGTHVAGIVAAENNQVGGVGIAYNCKIMVLKAGNSSGYFNNSDIAEAIQYAYMNGASVINMSFGGSNISHAAEDALTEAYNQCVLVAAAGNSGLCNQPGCPTHPDTVPHYPAALPYVIGVMSTNANGSAISGFSNFDHYPHNSLEYEVYAVGELVHSCWPGNKSATLSGTSMAAPMISGIAALLRSAFQDREMYSTKYLQSQIVNTGTINPTGDIAHSVANVYEALTKLPKPSVNLYDYYIDDSTTISEENNGNGVVDAGETIRLFVSLHNRGGVATDVNVSIDTMRNNNPTLTDPYFTFVNPEMHLSDIGIYSVRESGEQYFEVIVSPECPNDYLVDFNIRFTYCNGMDEKDTTVYTDDGKQKAQFAVSRGFLLPSTITKDTVYRADRLYIVGEDVVISEGVTVTFEAGCEIQFYDDREYYDSPRIMNYGILKFEGTQENMVKIHPSAYVKEYICFLVNYGELVINYADTVNLKAGNAKDASGTPQLSITNSFLYTDENASYHTLKSYRNGSVETYNHWPNIYAQGSFEFSNNYIELDYYIYMPGGGFSVLEATGNYFFVKTTLSQSISISEIFEDNIVYTCNGEDVRLNGSVSFYGSVQNNSFVSAKTGTRDIIQLDFNNSVVSDNSFSELYKKYASQSIENYYDATGTPTVDVYGSCTDIATLWPYPVSIELFNKDGEKVNRIGHEEITVRVTFNRPMDTTQDTYLTFGTIEPYADYRINGSYISETVWEGTYALKAQIENGQNFLKVNNARAKDETHKEVFGEHFMHEFTIDTTAALAMNLQANPTDNGIELRFAQDDYDTLLGYNIYRAEAKDGYYTKLNPTIVLSTDETFLDENAEPGKTYWYTYTVVLSDFTESAPAGKVTATAKDTIAPSMYHTPVNQGYVGSNLVITCTANDNVGVDSVVLYYRTVGQTDWKQVTMSRTNSKYSVAVFGSELELAGLEYYIVAYDANNSIARGSAEVPYTVVIREAGDAARIGDVDGDGVITVKDALMLLQATNDLLILDDGQFRRADLNADGLLSAMEALRILQYVSGKVTTIVG